MVLSSTLCTDSTESGAGILDTAAITLHRCVHARVLW